MIGAARRIAFLALACATAALACAAPTPSPTAPGSDVEVVRSALTTNVTITVLDTSGVPQTGSQVYAEHTNGTVVKSGTVDTNGHAVIALNSGTYKFAVQGSPTGSGFSYFSSNCVVPSCTSASVTTQKPVQITVLDGWGTPAAGVHVEADDASGNPDNMGDTDDSGQLTLSTDPGTFQFQADYGGTYFDSDSCTVPGCTTATIHIPKPVQVTVDDGYGGTRPYANLAAVDTDGNEVTWTTTDDTGQATFYIPPGAYLIRAEAPDGTTFDSGESGSCVVPGCTSASISITDVLVTVTYSDGSPVTNQRVTAVTPDGTEVDWPTTDDQGQADAFVNACGYKFFVVVDGVEYDSGPDGSCTVPGCRTATITVAEAPVVVTVVDGSGQPIANQDVTAQASGGATCDQTTDAQGHAAFVLSNDAYRFSASCGAQTFYSGDVGSCVVPGCSSARITMVCGGCAGKPDGTACSDGNACTQTDTCQAGTCVGSNPVTCSAADQCHAAGTCDPASGTCSNPAKADGTACNDGNACTQTDTCQSGTCVGGNPVSCVASDQCHAAGTCSPSTGACSNPAAANGTACNDGNACTQADTCQSGACTGGNPITCTAQDQCHSAGTCDPASGACSNPAKANGTACNDGNACTVADACQGGTCSGTTVTCTAQDQCHSVGTCSPSTGTCSNPVVADGATCDDGNACTAGDSCHAGACVSGASTCTSLSIVETDEGFQVVPLPDVGNTFAASEPSAVPGDPVTFTMVVTNGSTFVGTGADTAVTNLGTTPFVWGSYQVTLEYLPVVGGDWVPIAKTSFDGTGAQSDDPPLLHLNFGTGSYVGQTVGVGQTGHFDSAENARLPSDLISRLADPAEVSQVRVELHLDTTDGTSGITADRDVTASFRDTDAEIVANVDGDVFLADQEAQFTRAALSPATYTLLPGDSVTLTAVATAPLVMPRQPGETDAQYLARLRAYNPYEALLELNVQGSEGLFINLIVPILSAQKSGPGQANAGVTLTYPVTLQNTGGADAQSIAVADTVDGSDAGGQISIPSIVAAGTTGTATIRAAAPIGQSPGPYTDLATVSWQDRNGNVYGPVSSSFTTALAVGHPEGYLTLVASGVTPAQLLGTSVTLTATALDSTGSPVVGLPVQLVIAGSNPQTVPLVIGADGTASFTYDGHNLGADRATVTATINGPTLTASAPAITWSTQDGTPCNQATPLDVMMLVDDSPSMFSEDTVAAVKAATTALINDLHSGVDQVSGSAFMANAVLDAPLTADLGLASSELNAAIQLHVDECTGFCGGGTGYLSAFTLALNELQGPRHRPNATPIIVLLSDGGNTGPDYAAELAAVKAAGVRIISLGYGTNVDVLAMRAIASSPNDYFYAPSSSELGWVYSNVTQDTCRSLPPLVSAGGDQGLYEVRLPATLTLQGEAHGDGTRGDLGLTSTWTEASGPAPVAFTNPSSPVTDVVFTEPGTYVLQLEVTDGFITTASRATVVVDPAPSLAGANLAVALSSPGPLVVGTPETFTATLTDAQSHPIGNFTIELIVSGANPTSALLTTNATGVATFTYAGAFVGTDVLQATALGGTAQLGGSPLSVAWTVTPGQTAAASQGWIGSPAQQTTVKGLVPVTVAANVTVVSATISYWPATSPTDVHTLAINVQGGPGATLATFDTTTLANDSYVVALSGTDDHGTQQTSAVLVTVTGDYKPGRETVAANEFTVPVAGIPIMVGRQYDSLNKDKVGDFGNGWALTVGHPDLQVDPANNVTITLPNGRRATFIFELFPVVAGPVVLDFLGLPTFAPEPGVFGTLTSDGCGLLSFDPSAPDPICFGAIDEASLRFAPTTYKYTDAFGTVYTMGADGSLKSIQDRTNNILTFTPDGITSQTSGQNVSFTRDGQGRITKILTPDLGDFFHGRAEYDYAYDANGNLMAATRPDVDGLDNTIHYTYDDGHRLLKAVDPFGHAQTSTFDDAGRLATDTDALGNVTKYAYDVPGHTTTTTYPDTGATAQTFDDNGMLLSMTDQLGRTTTHQYDANRNETKRTNALGEATTYTYDSNGNQTSVANALGERTTTTYNAFSEPLTTANPVGNTTTVAYDDNGLPTSLADSMGPLATFTSSEHGLPLTAIDASGNIVFLGYDVAGDLTSRIDRLGRATSYTYDGWGDQLTTTSPRGALWQYSYNNRGQKFSSLNTSNGQNGVRLFNYDSNGNFIADRYQFFGHSYNYVYDALNHLTDLLSDSISATHYTRDFRGNALTYTDEVGHVTAYAYDLAGQLLQTTNPDGTFTTQTFDALGRVSSKTDERGNTTTYTYEPGCDCTNRLTAVIDPLGRTTSTTYDGMGRRTSTTDAAGRQTSYAYDLRGHLIETDFPDGTATHDTYDTLGRRVASADQTGATTHYGYDVEGELLSVTDPLNNVTQYAYDADGNLSSVTDANGHLTSYTHDLMNRKIGRTLPLGMTESFTYDAVGNQLSHTDFRGKTTSMAYDAFDRLVTKAPDPSLGEPTVSWTYNLNGMRASMTDASGTTNYTYDTRNRLLTKATPEGTLTYTYDPSGNVASIDSSNANGTSVSYVWDAANELLSVTDNRLGGMTTAAYTATGRPANLAQPNGVGLTYAYDSLDRVMSMAWKKRAGPALASFAYTYSPRGQRLTAADVTGREATYDYNAASRLTSETITGDPSGNGALTYVLDAVGNRLSRASTLMALGAQSFSYDVNDELTSHAYDLNGNTTSSDGNTYTYDFENHLVSKDGGAVTVVYDGDGNRVAKTVSDLTTKYLTDDLNPTGYLQVIDEVSNGAVQVRYTYGNMLVSETQNASGGPATSFYGYDAHRNVAFLSDATGAVTDTYQYDAWGNVIAQNGNTPNTRLYEGQEVDTDLGLINLRARLYSPNEGRFLTMDPLMGRLLKPTSLNRYLAADADPQDLWDPNGSQDGLEYVAAAQFGIAVLTAATASYATHLLAQRYYESIDSWPVPQLGQARKPDCDNIYRLAVGICATKSIWQIPGCFARATLAYIICKGGGTTNGLPGG